MRCAWIAFFALVALACAPVEDATEPEPVFVVDRARLAFDLAPGEVARFAAWHSSPELRYLRVVVGRAPVDDDSLLGSSLSCPEDLALVVALTGASQRGAALEGGPIVGAASSLASGCARALYPVPAGYAGAATIRALDGRGAGEVFADVDFVVLSPAPQFAGR